MNICAGCGQPTNNTGVACNVCAAYYGGHGRYPDRDADAGASNGNGALHEPVAIADAQSTEIGRKVILTRASTIKPELVQWLWSDRLPLHDLAVIAGEPGLGKSTTTAKLTALVTRGDLDGALHRQPRDVLIATAEDHFASVVLGRLTAADANLDRVHHVTVTGDDGDGLLSLPGDIDGIAEKLKELAATTPAAFVVVDPIAAFIAEGTDTHRDAAVRRILAPLAAMAQDQGVCVLAVAHLNKSNAGKLLDRLGGSVAFGAAPRSVLAFARDPDDPGEEQGSQRVIVHAKSNHGVYAPTIAAHIEGLDVEGVGSVSRLVIDGETDVSSTDLTKPSEASGEDVRDAIIDTLRDGQRSSREVKAEVTKTCGVSSRTVERAASRMVADGELEQHREGIPPTGIWSLIQLRHANCDTAVAIGSVAIGNRPQLLAIGGGTQSNCDTPERVSQLGLIDQDQIRRLQRLARYDQLGQETFAEALGVDAAAVIETPVEALLGAFPRGAAA